MTELDISTLVRVLQNGCFDMAKSGSGVFRKRQTRFISWNKFEDGSSSADFEVFLVFA